MICKYCGMLLEDDSAFCENCGRKIERDALSKEVASEERQQRNGSERFASKSQLKYECEEYECEEEFSGKHLSEGKRVKTHNKQKKVKIAIGTIIAVIIAIFTGNAIVMSERTTYSSEAEMKAEVAGTYTCYGNDYDIDYQIKIEGDTVTKRWYNLGSDSDMELTVKSWNPKRGTFEIALGTIIVTNDGDLKYDGELYEGGGYWSDFLDKKAYGSLYNYSSNNGYSDLTITVDSVSSNSSYTICTGSVKNNGTKTYYYVEVKGAFKDSSGNVIDTDWTYAAGSEGLAPGESTTFRLSVTKDFDIESCTVSLLDFD